MGLFDRFKTSQTLTAEITSPEDVTDLEPTHMRLVPDVDDETNEFEESVREHLERLTAAADSDIASLTTAEFDEALTSRLVGAERIQSTGLGFSYASHFADHVHEVLTLDLPSAVVTLPDSRIAETGRHVQPGQPGSQQPARPAQHDPGRRAPRRRGQPQRLRRHERLALHRELRALPQRGRPPLAARRRRPQRLRLRAPLPARDHPPAVLDAQRDPRRPRPGARVRAAVERRRREPGVAAHLPLVRPADLPPDHPGGRRVDQHPARRGAPAAAGHEPPGRRTPDPQGSAVSRAARTTSAAPTRRARR